MRGIRVTRALAIVGSILVWLPLIAPLALSSVRLVQAGRLRIDYLMPAELFALVLVGGGLLLSASLRARSHRRLIAWSLGAAVGLLTASMFSATVTGLASGAAEPRGWRVVLVAGLLAGYVAAVLALAVGGVLLARSLLSGSQRDAGG